MRQVSNRLLMISVSSRQIDKDIELIFENTGNQLNNSQAWNVFDCFWRGDASRSNTGIHSGIGLAIVKQLVIFLGGNIQLETSNDIFTIRLYFPSRFITFKLN
jgi:signal transduction histidine kinase